MYCIAIRNNLVHLCKASLLNVRPSNICAICSRIGEMVFGNRSIVKALILNYVI